MRIVDLDTINQHLEKHRPSKKKGLGCGTCFGSRRKIGVNACLYENWLCTFGYNVITVELLSTDVDRAAGIGRPSSTAFFYSSRWCVKDVYF